ncbi:beta-ketoacyl-[acyl-carrier-protein] synthase family protein [Streptomyces sp. H27-D2]|uniref:beta-ketoacyl-[acyl-carrier-protein] synthase family protein n=1 Tax=Streptomyces sp. H27-D2 TaxID=3046304 RepID=UPI002DBB5EC3|nr:beta-ketoacyl-[acyl-carrier-protein] synthase family protein [Streptomyces sp. H27-D2]MEC4020683.1 beta-ketoacyl-[acyl-carrier-protein] synthase family protein [Streptomyces sp. H27-D2]
MARAIAVTGIGLITPAGIGTEATWQGVCGGVYASHPDPELDGLPVTLACRVPGFDPRTSTPARQPWRYDRATQFLFAAAHEALADAGLDRARWDADRVALVVGSAAGGIGILEAQHRKLMEAGPTGVSPLTLTGFLPNMTAGHLALDLGIRGPSLQTSTACASGATAVITASLLLEAGLCDIALAGGTDAMITPLCASAFAKMGALSRNHHSPGHASRPFDRDRDGFVLGEGAGLLVLERTPHAHARGARTLAVLVGHGTTSDAYHATAPDPDGAGLRRAISAALADADAHTRDVDHINAHGTSTPLNDRVEATAIRELFGPHAPTVSAAKGVLGHTMGASGAIDAALTVLSIARGCAPPTANFEHPDDTTGGIDLIAGKARTQDIGLALSHSLGFGGHNTVLALAHS